MKKFIPITPDLTTKFCQELVKQNGSCDFSPTELIEKPDKHLHDVVLITENYANMIGGSVSIRYEDATWYSEIEVNGLVLTENNDEKETLSDSHVMYAIIKSYLSAVEYLRSLRNIPNLQSFSSDNNIKH
ncbi:MAG: hypothetical protein MK137_05345 [Rickettsiales bacterium]|nr:hypothetical protein [Rickettsiales bacterium]